jgi:hypothetical protein
MNILVKISNYPSIVYISFLIIDDPDIHRQIVDNNSEQTGERGTGPNNILELINGDYILL